MAAPAGKLTTTAPFFIGGILRRKEDTKVDHPVLTPAGGDRRTLPPVDFHYGIRLT